MNNKGFAISSMIYSILLLFLMLILGVFALLGSRKIILDKVKSEIITDITQYKMYSFSFEHKNILLANTSKVADFEFSLLDGIKVIDQNGNVIETEITVASEPVFDSTQNGVYQITYTANYEGTVLEDSRTIQVIDPIIYEYVYTGREQQFTVPVNGIYKAELWGASGGNGYSTYLRSDYSKGGNGAYTSGLLSLKSNTKLYVTVGGKGIDSPTDKSKVGVIDGGYNGGGTGRSWDNGNSYIHNGAGGGGATHLSLKSGLLKALNNSKESVLMVSAGGGGGGGHEGQDAGGAAGGLSGSPGYQVSWEKNQGGTQSAGGVAGQGQYGKGDDGSFGLGGDSFSSGAGGGGGAGYYGGAGGSWNAGGGGSSYINGYSGCSMNNSDYLLLNPIMKSGTEVMPGYDGTSTMTGNVGSGRAKFTALIIDNGKIATNLIKNGGFEKGNENWAFSGVELVSNVSASGKNSIQFSPSITAMSTQTIMTPIAGHIYYGGLEFLSTKTFTAADNRFEWFLTDAANSLMVFANKRDQTETWKRLTARLSLDAPNSGNWIIRNFFVNASEKAYADDLFILDLTEIYGAGNEPPKEWCDQNIKYFDGVGIIPSYNF